MIDLIKKLTQTTGLYKLAGASSKQITLAQEKLSFKFPVDYHEFLKNFGAVSFGNCELLGIALSDSLNVVIATERERKLSAQFPLDMILIENYGYESLLALMDKNGTIYQWSPTSIKQIATSFSEYVLARLNEQ